MTDEEVKSIIVQKALDYNVPHQYSQFYDSLTIDEKNYVGKIIEKRCFGLPLIKFWHPNGRWLILGTNEICYFNNVTISFIGLMDISDYYTLDRERVRQIEPDIKQRRFLYERLEIITIKGIKHELHINNRWEYETFWTILHKILRIRNAPIFNK